MIQPGQFRQINVFIWVIFLYIIGYIIFRQAGGEPPGWQWALPLVVIGFASMVARTYFGSRRPEGVFTFTPWITFIDIFIIAIGIYLTGRRESPLWLLYFPLLLSEMFTARSHQVIWMFIMTSILFYLAVLPLKELSHYTDLSTRLFFLFVAAGIVRSINKAHVQRERELSRLREQITLGDERQRIAREFHDGLGHTLVNIVLGMELAKRMVKKDQATAGDMIKDQVKSLREALDEMRYVVWQLQPSNEHRGLPNRLRLFAKQMFDRTGIKANLECPDSLIDIPPTVEVILSRVVQEGLNNIARHAIGAKSVSILLKDTDTAIELNMVDDGHGFELSKVIGGFGIQHMKERIEALGGTFELKSVIGEGTTVHVYVPKSAIITANTETAKTEETDNARND